MEFLYEHAPEIADEMVTFYSTQMSKQYYNHFKSYIDNLLSLVTISTVLETDLLGAPAVVAGFWSSARTESDILKSFQLGDRGNILGEIDKNPIIYHVAKVNNFHVTFEGFFRSCLKLLCDTISSESVFFKSFFFPTLSDVTDGVYVARFSTLFAPTAQYFKNTLNTYLSTPDVVSVLVLIRVVQLHQVRSSNLAFLDSLLLLLWPAAKSLIEKHVASIRLLDCNNVKPDKVLVVVLSRYIELVSAFYILFEDKDESVLVSQRFLRGEIERWLLRLAQSISKPKLQVVFLIKNYEYLIASLTARSIVSECASRFESLLNSQITLFVEEELLDSASQANFSHFISFLKTAEISLNHGGNLDAGRVETIIRDFSESWKEGIGIILANINRFFDVFVVYILFYNFRLILRCPSKYLNKPLLNCYFTIKGFTS